MVLEVRTLHAVIFEDLKLTCFKMARISGSTSPMRKTFYSSYVARHSFSIELEGCICLFVSSIDFARINANTTPRPDNHLEHF